MPLTQFVAKTPHPHESPAQATGEKDTLAQPWAQYNIKMDPRYRKPFHYGWCRKVVFRANSENTQKSKNCAEVYYHSPNGKKLRTKSDITAELWASKNQNLNIADFTFAKETVGMPATQEFVRRAKIRTPKPKMFEKLEISRSIPRKKRPPEKEVTEVIALKTPKLNPKSK